MAKKQTAPKKRVVKKKTVAPSKNVMSKPVHETEGRKATEILAGVLAALSVLLAVMVIVATHRSQTYANIQLERFIREAQTRLDLQDVTLNGENADTSDTSDDSAAVDVGGPLAFNFDDTNVKVTLTSFTVLDRFNPQEMLSRSADCGVERPLGYFDALTTDYANALGYEYIFTYTGESQAPESYSVTVVPNVTHYASFNTFVADYDLCSAGGDAYPIQLDPNWLIFGSSCGTGFSDDSGLPVGCIEARTALGDGIVTK